MTRDFRLTIAHRSCCRFRLGSFSFSFLTSLLSPFPFRLPYVQALFHATRQRTRHTEPFERGRANVSVTDPLPPTLSQLPGHLGEQEDRPLSARIPLTNTIRDPAALARATCKITGRGGCAKYCGTAPSPGNISFSSFRQSFTTNVNYLKRRFSSGDLSSELDDEPSTDSGLASMARDSSQSYQAVPERPLQSQPTPVPPASQPPVPGAPPPGPPQPVGGDLSLNLRPGSRTTSAPSSPAKTRESLLQRVQSLTGAARDQGGLITANDFVSVIFNPFVYNIARDSRYNGPNTSITARGVVCRDRPRNDVNIAAQAPGQFSPMSLSQLRVIIRHERSKWLAVSDVSRRVSTCPTFLLTLFDVMACNFRSVRSCDRKPMGSSMAANCINFNHDQGASILGAAVSSATRGPSYNKDRCFTLLVIDDQNTDWSKYFRGRRLHGDYEIRVEQAEFRELSLTASEAGTIVSMAVYRNGTKVIRSFKPDFVLVRQNLRDAGEDYKNLLLGFMYGGIPSVNNLTAIYNFQDKPWVFAHLLGLQRRLGKDNFPLIDQTYYPNHREMYHNTYKSYQMEELRLTYIVSRYVLKLGNAS
ncbi:Synapsin [Eufriesea mexicana]|nr:Synapsin [Eufriesea mexicana]